MMIPHDFIWFSLGWISISCCCFFQSFYSVSSNSNFARHIWAFHPFRYWQMWKYGSSPLRPGYRCWDVGVMPLSTSLSLACLLFDPQSDDVLALRCEHDTWGICPGGRFPWRPESYLQWWNLSDFHRGFAKLKRPRRRSARATLQDFCAPWNAFCRG